MIEYFLVTIIAGIAGGLVFRYGSTCYKFCKYQYDNIYEAKKMGKKIISIPYRYRHQDYYALLPISSKKSYTILSISTKFDKEEDVYTKVLKYMGHNFDFNGCYVTPTMLGYSNLKFKIIKNNGDLSDIEFAENQHIIIN